jgi:hypothetical protein
MKPYAEGTEVPVSKSKVELDTLLSKCGATSRGILADDEHGQAIIAFALAGGRYRLTVPLPRLGDFPKSGQAPRDWAAWPDAKQAEWRYRRWEQASRERWRAVILLIKAKLQIVQMGLSSAAHEFMGDLILSNGQTVSELVATPGNRWLPPAGSSSQEPTEDPREVVDE